MAVSKIKGEIRVITVPQCRWVAFEVVPSLGTFRRASRSTKLVENPGKARRALG